MRRAEVAGAVVRVVEVPLLTSEDRLATSSTVEEFTSLDATLDRVAVCLVAAAVAALRG